MNRTYTLEQIEAELIYLNSITTVEKSVIQPNMFEVGLKNYTKAVLKFYDLDLKD